jgi:hypothetical protein
MLSAAYIIQSPATTIRPQIMSFLLECGCIFKANKHAAICAAARARIYSSSLENTAYLMRVTSPYASKDDIPFQRIGAAADSMWSCVRPSRRSLAKILQYFDQSQTSDTVR